MKEGEAFKEAQLCSFGAFRRVICICILLMQGGTGGPCM